MCAHQSAAGTVIRQGAFLMREVQSGGPAVKIIKEVPIDES